MLIKRTRSGYPILGMTDDPIELESVFGLEHATEREQAELERFRDPDARAAFLLTVRCLAHLGYLPDLDTIPATVRTYITEQIGANLPTAYFQDRPARRTEVLTAARTVLMYQRWTLEKRDQVRDLMFGLAFDYPREADLIRAAIERLQDWRVELPAEQTLITLAESVLHQAEEAIYSEVLRRADTKLDAAIAALLGHPESEATLLEIIKRPAGKSSVRSMKRVADKLTELTRLGIPEDVLSGLGQRKIVFLAEQAHRYTAADLLGLHERRRALILLAFVIRSLQIGRDTMLEQCDKLLRRMTRTSQKNEDKALLAREKGTSFTRRLSTKILEIIALSPPGTVEQQLFAYLPREEYQRMYKTVSGEDRHFAEETARAAMLRSFRRHYRKMLPLLLTHITFQAQSTAGKEVVAMLALLKQHATKRTQQLTLPDRPSFLDPAWDDVTVLSSDSASSNGILTVARRPLELQTLLALQGALKSGIVWVPNSERYGNLVASLVAWDTPQRQRLYDQHQFPSTAQDFITKLLSLMHEALTDLEQAALKQDAVAVKGKVWAVPKIKEDPIPKSVLKLEQQIITALRYPKITEVLTDSDATLGITESFIHYADKETRATKQKRRDILATLFCDAANIGPTKMALSTPGLSAGSILWTQRWYNYRENLRQGIILCNNYVNRSPLARYWGDGKTVSFDGMQLATYDNNTRAELHLRYLRGSGGLFLQHVSNKLTGLFGQFAACSSPEAAHVLVGLLNHGTELDVDTVDTDSIGDHTLALGLGWLLGFTIRPRIKRIKYAKLVRPTRDAAYPTIDALFLRTLNTKIIEEHYDEIVHLVCSLAEGAVSPDLVLKRFNSYSRKGGVHQALLEIGRAVHTIFVARYLEDPDLRREIHRNLCRGEAWNAMSRIIFSFNRAIMRENNVDEQERLALSLLLVQNMIVVWNVSHMSRAILALKKEGMVCGRTELKHITPLLTSHIRMIPDFVIEFDRARNMTDMIAQPL